MVEGLKAKLKIFLAVFISCTTLFCQANLIDPCFRKEAKRHNVSESLTFLVVQTKNMAATVSSPIVGILIMCAGPRKILMAGLWLNAVCVAGFGLLEYCEPADIFLIGSFVAIAVAAFCSSCVYISTLTYAAKDFPPHSSLVIGSTETFAVIAQIVAALCGELFYSSGGFHLPFMFFSLIQAACVPLVGLMLPRKDNDGPKKPFLRAALDILKETFIDGIKEKIMGSVQAAGIEALSGSDMDSLVNTGADSLKPKDPELSTGVEFNAPEVDPAELKIDAIRVPEIEYEYQLPEPDEQSSNDDPSEEVDPDKISLNTPATQAVKVPPNVELMKEIIPSKVGGDVTRNFSDKSMSTELELPLSVPRKARKKVVRGSMKPWSGIGVPGTLLMGLTVLGVAGYWAFLTSQLDKHLGPLALTKDEMSIFLFTFAIWYGVSCPASGWLADQLPHKLPVIFAGAIFIGLRSVLLGPLVNFGIKDSLWLSAAVILVIPDFRAAVSVPSFGAAVVYATNAGYADNADTYASVFSLLNALASVGSLLGATFGGKLVSLLGFPYSSGAFGVAFMLWGLLLFLFYKCKKEHGPVKELLE